MSILFHNLFPTKHSRLWSPVAALAVGTLFLFFPLLRSFHIDSAIIAGVIGAFAGTWTAGRNRAGDRDVLPVVGLVYIAALPLLIRDLVAGCFSWDGMAFWFFIPLFSILFGFSLGRLIRIFFPRCGRIISTTAVFCILAGSLLLTFFLFPQLYFFNHVFGYWPGPIYDESVTFPAGLALYRTITLAWIGVFWLIPRFNQQGHIARAIFLMLIASLALNYVCATRSGIISPASHIQSELGGIHQTDHFSLYYSMEHYSPGEINFLGRLHEFHFQELIDTLQVEWPEDKRIESYLYGHEWQMQNLTGARMVSFVPVWQRTPQMHIRKSALERTLRHELVHVIARSFGNTLLNASWNIGLVEGLAVALSPASGSRITTDQVVVANEAYYSQGELERLFSLTGFYRESGSVAYAVSGSYVATLLREYPVEHFKNAYRRSSLKKGYQELMTDAITRWHDHLAGVDVTAEERKTAEQVFSRPSIFDADCPRKVTRLAAQWDRYRQALAEGDTTLAVTHLEVLQTMNPDSEAIWLNWMRLMLDRNQPQVVLERSAGLPEHPMIAIRLADALVMAGEEEEAGKMRSQILAEEQLSKTAQRAWERRENMMEWRKLLALVHPHDLSLDSPPAWLMDSESSLLPLIYFSEWFRRNTVPVGDAGKISQDGMTLRLNSDALISRAFLPPTDSSFFETYRQLIYLASFTGQPGTALHETVRHPGWRPIQQARIGEAYRFYLFIQRQQNPPYLFQKDHSPG